MSSTGQVPAGLRASWTAKSLVVALGVVMGGELADQMPQLPLAEDDEVLQTFASDCFHEPFRVRVAIWTQDDVSARSRSHGRVRFHRPMGATESEPQGRPAFGGARNVHFPQTVGDYEIVAPLGRGGMGIVFLAKRRSDGTEVAIKTVHTEKEASLAAIRREIHALSRLRHPYVVRILEQGVSDGVPWYAMEYVPGPTLSARCGSSETTLGLSSSGDRHDGPRPPDQRPLEFREILAIGAALCHALAYVHGEGVVHRDLKPRNVVLPSEHDVVLVDFGLVTGTASEPGREVLERGALALGTPAYVSPEQIRGDIVDARADLYSLGCVLYEMATGRTPFVGDTAQLLRAHEEEGPVVPSLRRSVPRAFDDLVMSLLAKDAAGRIGHATDVLRELERLGAPLRDVDAAHPKPYLYRSPFVGRSRVCDDLTEQILRDVEGQAPLFLISGESGSGKTRLVHEISRRVRAHEIASITAQCVPTYGGDAGSSSALHPFRDVLTAVADRCRAGGLPETERLLGARCRLLGPYEPRLTWIPGYSSAPEPEPLAPEAERHRLLDAIDRTLEALVDDARLLLVFEDVHWADQLTRLYLRGVVQGRYAHSRRLRILATYRADQVDAELQELATSLARTHVEIHAMDGSQIASLVAGMLALRRCPPELSFVVEQAAGNPFFAGELLRSLLGEQELDRAADGSWSVSSRMRTRSAPPALEAVIRSRVKRLSPMARRMVDLVSVAGNGCDLTLAEQASDLMEADRLDAQEELLAKQILELRDGGELHFIHDKIRATIYADLDPGQRHDLHGACAVALERGDTSAGLTQHRLAHHFGQSGAFHRALSYLERIADRALAAGAYQEARSAGITALSYLATPPAIPASSTQAPPAAWERRVAQAALALGRLDECEEHARRSLVAANQPPPRTHFGWCALLGWQVAVQAIHLVLPPSWIARSYAAPALIDAAQVAGVLGRLAFYANDPVRMLACSFLAINLAERAGTNVERPRNYAGLGFTCHLFGVTSLGDHYFRQARASGGAARDNAGTSFALTTEALSRVGEADWVGASEALARAREICARTGDPQESEIVGVLASHVSFYTGRIADASSALAEVEASVRDRGNLQIEAWAMYLQGRIDLATGQLERAEQRILDALERTGSQPDAMSEITSWGLLSETRALAGDASGATQAADHAERLLLRHGPTVFLVGHGYIGLAARELARARRAESPAAIRQAARRALTAGRRLARLARMFPVLAPDALRTIGEARCLLGDERRGRRTIDGSARKARELRMPLHEALATFAQARTMPPSPARQERVDDATAALQRLGCGERAFLEIRSSRISATSATAHETRLPS